MPVKWKRSSRFKPELPLGRIAAARTRNPEGAGSSFSGWELNYSLPLLHSMLEFPQVARDMDHANLIWRTVANDPGDLTKESFLSELNRQLEAELAQREQTFYVLTSISLDNAVKLGTCTVDDVQIDYVGTEFPRKFARHRAEVVGDPRVPAQESPPRYTKLVASIRSKKASLAFTAALRAIDLERSLWCLFSNSQMEMLGRSWIPINKVRLGSAHTVHLSTGVTTENEYWFEPHHVLSDPFQPNDAPGTLRLVRRAQRRLKLIPYRHDVVDALLLCVRALDEWNPNSAFVRLWSALERLTSPGYGDYESVVRRCAFVWKDVDFAIQTLEHLREYRNTMLHSGGESTHAKSYCFQLQQHFRPIVLFHINNAGRFETLKEANHFLDLPTDDAMLKRRELEIGRARKFRSPKST